ncbi:MAG: hypothetical protein ACE145_20940 [Terriglobia bacterium]
MDELSTALIKLADQIATALIGILMTVLVVTIGSALARKSH